MLARANNFNLMRLVFAFLVIVSHSPELIDGNRSREPLTQVFGTYSFGGLAVASFFILSGYLITSSWMNEPQWAAYFRKRLLRIVPGFAVAGAICLLIVGPFSSLAFWDAFNPIKFFAQLPLLMYDLPGFYGQKQQIVNGAIWTIHYEFACYALLGVLGVKGLLSKPRMIGALFAACLTGYIGYIFIQDHATPTLSGIANSLWTRLGHYLHFTSFFLSGVCFYFVRNRVRYEPKYFALAAVVFILMMYVRYTAPIALAIPYAYILFYIGHAKYQPAKGLQHIDLSYGLYLYAWPIQQLLIKHGVLNPWIVTGLTAAIGLTIAAGSWFCVERPALKLKDKQKAQQRLSAANSLI